MSDFGALTDHFGILAIVRDGGTLADVLTLVDSSKTPVAESRADAMDENNDIAASTFYGAGDLFEASSTFALTSSTLDTALLLCGEIAVQKFVQSVEISTSNDGWPQITVSGTLGAETMDTSTTNQFSLPSYTLNARKQAQQIGFTTGAGCKLTGSSLSASVELAQQEDGVGEPVAHDVSGGTIEISADFTEITAAPSWTDAAGTAWASTETDLTETKAPGRQGAQAAYATGTGTAAGTLTRDAA